MKQHYDDLTKIVCPLNMLDDDTYTRLRQHRDNGGPLQAWYGGQWEDREELYHGSILSYRAKPEPKATVGWHGINISHRNAMPSLETAKAVCAPLKPELYLRAEWDETGNLISVEVEKDQ